MRIESFIEMHEGKLFGLGMAHSFPSLFVFEWILNNYPLDYIIEIGTGGGGLSLYLYFQFLVREMGFSTYDIEEKYNKMVDARGNKTQYNIPKIQKNILTPHFNKRDIFDKETISEIEKILSENKTLLYCDNGRKPEVLKLYSKYVNPKSILATHDFGRAIKPFHVNALLRTLNFEEIPISKFCDVYRTYQRFWYKHI